jgi:alpha/beta superfamily hydrolase
MHSIWFDDSLTVESVSFFSDGCRLEGELAYTDGTPQAGVVLAGPHPLLGGSKDNNVIRALGDGLATRGYVTLRFNYKGVGASDGPAADTAAHLAEFWRTSHAPDDSERSQDLRVAVEHLRGVVGLDCPIALVGYSFGCTLLPDAIPDPGAAAPLVLVAPTIGRHDYSRYETLRNRKCVIAPHNDFASDAQLLHDWFSRMSGPKQLVQRRLDGHFFRGHEDWLVAVVGSFLDDIGSSRA